MLIDWFTVAAQLVNFLILVWLLRRFLYQPVLKAIEERERKIAGELEHAATAEQEASREQAEWKRKNEEFENRRAEMLRVAAAEVEQTRSGLLTDARKEYETLHTRLQESLSNEQRELEQETIRTISNEVFALTGKILSELADASLEEKIVEAFCRRLQMAGEDEIADMRSAMTEQKIRPVVRSRFEFGPEERLKIEQTVKSRFDLNAPLSFETSAEGNAGIELCMNGRCISWTFGTAIDSLRNATRKPDLHDDEDTALQQLR
ncbi:MAG: F0F1 ATP synthase subunit B [Chlorobiaceae bacterium]|nr:F0F1 ATP synthase subunit B [Chlorobiaceae bacterium]